MAKSRGKILLIEDDKNLGLVIKDYLELSGYHVLLRDNGKSGLNEYYKNSFELLLIDIMMPFLDGFSIAEEIRKTDCVTPIIFITAKSMTEDKIKGFKIGADDYITKPFNTEELKLRMEAILRRVSYKIPEPKESKFIIGKLIFDNNNHILILDEKEIRLTKRESEVLRLLYLNKNNVLKRDIALKTIWGENDYFMGRSMDVYITKLRKLLKADSSVSIINIHNTGFMLEIK